VLAIDGGNSKTDLALVAADGTLLAALRGPGASQEVHGIAGLDFLEAAPSAKQQANEAFRVWAAEGSHRGAQDL